MVNYDSVYFSTYMDLKKDLTLGWSMTRMTATMLTMMMTTAAMETEVSSMILMVGMILGETTSFEQRDKGMLSCC